MSMSLKANPNLPLTKITLLVVSTLTVMAGATIAPALPAMRANFADVANIDLLVGLVLTIPGLSIVIGAPIAGLIVDRYGRKLLLMESTVLYGITGASGFFFDSLTAILIGRVLLGFAVAGIMISVTTLIADYYDGDARARFLGRQAAFMNFGGVLFAAAGGLLADVTWQTPFLIYLVAFVILPFTVIFLFEPNRNQPTNQGTHSEANGERFPLKQLALIYIAALIMMTIFMLMIIQLPFLLEEVAGSSATQSGLAISGAILFSIPPALLYGRIINRIDVLSIVSIGFALFGVGYVVIGSGSGFAQIFVGSAIAGLGLGVLTPTFTVWLTSRTPEMFRGRAFGLLTTFLFFGQFISAFVSQPISQQVGLGVTFALVGALTLAIGAVFFVGGRVSARTPVPFNQH